MRPATIRIHVGHVFLAFDANRQGAKKRPGREEARPGPSWLVPLRRETRDKHRGDSPLVAATPVQNLRFRAKVLLKDAKSRMPEARRADHRATAPTWHRPHLTLAFTSSAR